MAVCTRATIVQSKDVYIQARCDGASEVAVYSYRDYIQGVSRL